MTDLTELVNCLEDKYGNKVKYTPSSMEVRKNFV